MAQAKTGDTVKVHYTGKLDDDTVFDTSEGREPLQFTIGEGRLIPDFEQAVVGMEPGETKTIQIPAGQSLWAASRGNGNGGRPTGHPGGTETGGQPEDAGSASRTARYSSSR